MYMGLQRTQKRNKKTRSRETALLEPDKFMVRPIRIERMTLGLGVPCSILLSYGRIRSVYPIRLGTASLLQGYWQGFKT